MCNVDELDTVQLSPEFPTDYLSELTRKFLSLAQSLAFYLKGCTVTFSRSALPAPCERGLFQFNGGIEFTKPGIPQFLLVEFRRHHLHFATIGVAKTNWLWKG